MTDLAIKVENLSKIYKLYSRQRHRVFEIIHPLRRKYHEDFYALNDLSFEIERGDTIGILGKNGSGKSTLLKLLTGVTTPTTGKVFVNGRVAALLELGSGFCPEFSGRDNVFFQGALLGFSRDEMCDLFPKIIEFADIGDFIEQPVKLYSSGMFLRLAFSIAVNVSPDILIVDEALAVGDGFFQNKCILRIRRMVESQGLTLLCVAHSLPQLKSICQKGMILEAGRLRLFDKMSVAADRYFKEEIIDRNDHRKPTEKPSLQLDKTSERLPQASADFEKLASYDRVQSDCARVVSLSLENEKGHTAQIVGFGEALILKILIEAMTDIDLLSCSFKIRNENGIELLATSLHVESRSLENLVSGQKLLLEARFTPKIQAGKYSITVALTRPADGMANPLTCYDFIPIAAQFEVKDKKPVPLNGAVYLESKIDLHLLSTPS